MPIPFTPYISSHPHFTHTHTHVHTHTALTQTLNTLAWTIIYYCLYPPRVSTVLTSDSSTRGLQSVSASKLTAWGTAKENTEREYIMTSLNLWQSKDPPYLSRSPKMASLFIKLAELCKILKKRFLQYTYTNIHTQIHHTHKHTHTHSHTHTQMQMQTLLLPLAEPGCLYTKQALWTMQAKLLEPGYKFVGEQAFPHSKWCGHPKSHLDHCYFMRRNLWICTPENATYPITAGWTGGR